MIHRTICMVSFCIAILAPSPAQLQNRSLPADLYSLVIKNPPRLSMNAAENFERILNYIREAPEFLPLALSIIFPEFQSDVVDLLLRYIAKNSMNAYTVRANDLSAKDTWRDKVQLTWILFVDDHRDLETYVHWQRDSWKANNQYLIVFTNEIATVSWRKIFEDLWKKYNVYRVIVASVQDDFQCLLKYLPFDRRHRNFGSIRRVCLKGSSPKTTENVTPASFDDVDGVSFIGKRARLFEGFQDLRNSFLNVFVFESLLMDVSYDEHHEIKLSKVDADVLAVLEKAMGVKFRVKVLRQSEFNGEDPFDVALRHIDNGDVEIVITGFFIKKYRAGNKYEFSSAVYEDKLCFLAPAASLIPKSYMPILPFQKDVWSLLLLYNTGITVLWFLVKYLSRSFRDRKPIFLPLMSTSFLDTGIVEGTSVNFASKEEQLPAWPINRPSKWVTSTTIDHPRHPRNFKDPRSTAATIETKDSSLLPIENQPAEIHPDLLSCFHFVETFWYPIRYADTAAQKAFLIGTLFFGLVVTGLYESNLVSSLSEPLHYPELNSVEEVINCPNPVISKYPNLKRSLVDDTPIGRQLDRRIRLTNTTTPTKDLIAYEKFIAITRYDSVKLENLTMYYDEQGNNLLHIVEECPVTYMVSYVMRLYSPYRERINSILLRLQGAGLVQFWYGGMIRPLEAEAKRRQMARRERKITLTLEHYALTFLLLFVGLFGGTAVFLGEMYFAWRPSR